MKIVDAQIHLWKADSERRPWPEEGKQVRHGPPEVTAADVLALMDAVGVQGAILVPPSFEGDRNDAVAEAVEAQADRFRALGRLTLDAPDAEERLHELVDDGRFIGIRVTFNARASTWLKDGTLEWLWPAAEKLNCPISMFPPGQVDAVGRVARDHPHLRISIDHLALGLDISDDAVIREVEKLCSLADYGNVAVKASALPAYVTEAYPFHSLGRVLREVIGAFGAERVFWGSDVTRLTCTYEQSLTYVSKVLSGLASTERELLLGQAIIRWFGISEWDTQG